MLRHYRTVAHHVRRLSIGLGQRKVRRIGTRERHRGLGSPASRSVRTWRNLRSEKLLGYDVTNRLEDNEGTVRMSFNPGSRFPCGTDNRC
jgi:uncharacterized protein YcfJ